MVRRQKPWWVSLYTISIFSFMALLCELYLPFSVVADSRFLLIWSVLFYILVSLWISRNGEQLENEPQPTDFVGRPIFNHDGTEAQNEPENGRDRPTSRYAARPVNASEVI